MIEPLESPIKKEIVEAAKTAVRRAAPASLEMDFDNYIINSAWEKFPFSVPTSNLTHEESFEFYKNGLGFIEQLLWNNVIDIEKRTIRKELSVQWEKHRNKETRLLEDARKAFHKIFPKGYTSFRKGCGNSHYFVARNVKEYGDEVSFRVSDHTTRYSMDRVFEFKRGNLVSLESGLNKMIESANSLKKQYCFLKLVK